MRAAWMAFEMAVSRVELRVDAMAVSTVKWMAAL